MSGHLTLSYKGKDILDGDKVVKGDELTLGWKFVTAFFDNVL
jgi:hypothetical protein